MFKSWNLFVVMLAALLAASCGSDNDTGSGVGNGFTPEGAPTTSSNCSTSKTSPGTVNSDWNQFKQHVYNCSFDYVVQNTSGYNNNNGYNYGNYGSYGYGNYAMMPLTAEYIYSVVRCDQYSGCYPYGNEYVTVGLDQSNGYIRSITDFRYGNISQGEAHNRLKNLVLNVSDVRKYDEKAFEFRKNGRKYIIDLTWPMVANPVSDMPVDGNSSNQTGYWISSEQHF